MQRCVKDRSQAERSTGSQIRHPGRPRSGRAWRRDYNRIMAQVTVRFFARYAELTGCEDRKSTRLNSSHSQISYAVFCLKKKKSLCLPDNPLPSRKQPTPPTFLVSGNHIVMVRSRYNSLHPNSCALIVQQALWCTVTPVY